MVDSLVITGVRPIQTEEGTITIVEGWNDYEVKEKHFYLEEELYSVVTFDGEDGIFWEVFGHGEKFKNEEAEKIAIEAVSRTIFREFNQETSYPNHRRVLEAKKDLLNLWRFADKPEKELVNIAWM